MCGPAAQLRRRISAPDAPSVFGRKPHPDSVFLRPGTPRFHEPTLPLVGIVGAGKCTIGYGDGSVRVFREAE